ncbi:hypothetical protein LGM65_00935 [Burkholderia anthina]|uniref:hypothetical protein n=1 Tax=Burkholderia anthina TaxID=179879 RepID=UPI001CF43AFA|nr:hypothetical protein [Burkholderia anthina]MCA8089458.1 hypothetical protein [Burkholderia anthina]
MAVDFDKLPEDEPVPDVPPSRLAWTTIFFVIVLGGVFLVLFFWPKGEPTQTPWFWVCVAVYPPGVASFVVLRRYSVYEGRRLDAIAWNEARKDYVNEVFEQASQPLAVLATSYRFSSDAKEDEFSKLLDGSVKLEPRVAAKPDTPPMNARWFEKPDADKDGIRFKSDDERRSHVVTWAFGAVIDEVAEMVRSLPAGLKLVIHLVLPDMASTDDAAAAWNEQWQKANLRTLQPRILQELPDLMYVDAWLDRVTRNVDQEARLLVVARVNTVLQAEPPDGSAESVVAILFAPEAVRRKFNLAPVAMMHRPNGTNDCPVNVALARALQWGRAEKSAIKRGWKSGLDGATGNAVTSALVKEGITAKPVNLDYMIGHAGEVAPWLGVACAAKAAARNGSVELVVTANETGPCFSVVRSAGTD